MVTRRSESGADSVEILPADRAASTPALPVGSGEPPSRQADGADLIKLLKAMRRRWRLALLGGLACSSLAAAAVYFGMPLSKLTASALVHVSEERLREIFETRESDVAYRTYQETQVILAKSRRVLEGAVNVPEIAALPTVQKLENPVDWLADQLKVDFPRGSEILTISMSANCPPTDLSALVNAVADAYLTQIVETERLERVARFNRLKELFASYQRELVDKRLKFKEMAGSIGTSDKQAAAVKQQMMVEHLGVARQELLRLQADTRRAQARLNVLASKPETVPTLTQASPRLGADRAAQLDPELMDMQRRLADLEKEEAGFKRLARRGASDPSVQFVQREMRQLTKAIEARRRGLIAAAAGHDRPDLRGASDGPASDGRRQEAEEYLEILREQEKSLTGEIAGLESQMSSLNVKSMDFHWLEDEIAVASDTAKMVGSEVQSMTVEMQAPPRIRLIERATTPRLTDPLRRDKYTAMAGLGVFGAFIGLVSFWEFRSRKVDMPNEVADEIGLRVIGDLPKLQGRPKEGEKPEDRERLVQSIDAVRTMLLSTGRIQSFQVVMIASAVKGEGKTSLSCHLATSLARAGRRTLLIDCDLRKPSLHGIFDVPPEPGACEILRGEIGWEDTIHQTLTPNLSLMCTGRFDTATVELLPQEQLADLLRVVRDQFDFVIVDTSPILQVTDPLIVSQYVDAVLFSVLREVSQLPQIHTAMERLKAMRVRILGAVVAGVPVTNRHYYGYYGTYR